MSSIVGAITIIGLASVPSVTAWQSCLPSVRVISLDYVERELLTDPTVVIAVPDATQTGITVLEGYITQHLDSVPPFDGNPQHFKGVLLTSPDLVHWYDATPNRDAGIAFDSSGRFTVVRQFRQDTWFAFFVLPGSFNLQTQYYDPDGGAIPPDVLSARVLYVLAQRPAAPAPPLGTITCNVNGAGIYAGSSGVELPPACRQLAATGFSLAAASWLTVAAL